MRHATMGVDFFAEAKARWTALAWVLLGVGLLVAVPTGYLKVHRDEQLAALQKDSQTSKGRDDSAKRTVASDPLAVAQFKRANTVIDALAVPWEDLFEMVEGANTKGLALLSLVPDPRDHSLHLAAEAKTLEDMLAYVSRLSAQPMLSDVTLISYATSQRDGSSVIQFALEAKWK